MAHDDAVCSHTVDPESAPVYLEATPSRSTLADGMPSEEVSLTLYNQFDTDITFNPHSWTVRRRSEEEWQKVRFQSTGDGTATLSSGESRSWTLTQVVESHREDAKFEPGTYTAEIGVPRPETDGWISCIATIRLESSSGMSEDSNDTSSGMSEDGNDTSSGMSEDGNDTSSAG